MPIGLLLMSLWELVVPVGCRSVCPHRVPEKPQENFVGLRPLARPPTNLHELFM